MRRPEALQVGCALLLGLLLASAGAAQDAAPPASPSEPVVAPPAATPAQDTPPVQQEAPPPETAPAAPTEPVAPPPQPAPAPATAAPSPAPEPALPLTSAPPPEPFVEPAPAAAASPASTTQTDTGAAAASGDEPAEEKLAWRNTQLIWDHALSTRSFDQNAQLSYNPTYVQSLSIRPRWYFTDSMYIRLRQDIELELTESDSTVTDQQVILLDTQLDVVETDVATFEDVSLRLGGQAFLPTSLASQAASRIFGLGALAGLSRDFAVLEGLNVDLSGAYRHYFATSNVASTDETYFCQLAGRDLAGPCDQAGGSTRVVDRFDLTLDASIAVIEELSFGIGLGGLWQRAAGLADAQVDLDGDGMTDLVLEDDSDTHWRNLTNTYLYASYTPVAWLSADLTLYTITGQIDPDGSRRNAFFGPDTMLSLSFAVTIDRLYQAARGRSVGSSASGARLP